METRAGKFNRLLDALDDVVAQETATLHARAFGDIAQIQRRAGPLFAGLVELGPEAADDVARARVAAIIARRQRNIEFLESQLAVTRDELLALQQSEIRMARVAPAYGRATPRQTSRLWAKG